MKTNIDKQMDSMNKNLGRIAEVLEKIYDKIDSEDIKENNFESQIITNFEERQTQIPDEVKKSSAKDLANKLLDFIKKEFPDEEKISVRSKSTLLWNNMNFNRWDLPSNLQLKIEQAETIAQKLLTEELNKKTEERLEEEKKALPKMVDDCVEWAREHGLKRLTLSDIEVFILEKDLAIHPKTKKLLYGIVNVEMKSK